MHLIGFVLVDRVTLIPILGSIKDIKETLMISYMSSKKKECERKTIIKWQLSKISSLTPSLRKLKLKVAVFTWTNMREGNTNVKEELRRILANWAWRSLYPNATVEPLPAIASDHSPINLTPRLH